MRVYDLDPDIVRWGLHHLDVCTLTNSGSPDTVTCQDNDLSVVGYVNEGYYVTKQINVENDEMIAHALQEELSRLAVAEASGSSRDAEEHNQASILSQDWLGPSKRHHESELESKLEDAAERGNSDFFLCPEEEPFDEKDLFCSPEIADASILDGEVGKRLNHMVPVPHVPRINGEIPSVDEATSDYQRLLDRLQLYNLVELKVEGDGNCQFRSLSDQIYRSTEHHKIVREQIVDQLKWHSELYEAYVPMAYDEYLKNMSKIGEWGDHVTLQAAADSYGVKLFVITSFKDTCYIEILPHTQKSNRIIFLSFWAEVHYNSIYPLEDLPEPETRKKGWWQWLGS